MEIVPNFRFGHSFHMKKYTCCYIEYLAWLAEQIIQLLTKSIVVDFTIDVFLPILNVADWF